MKGIIPIGGRGTRMRPATYTINKHFIPIANKPIIFYPIETLVAAGITDIAITYNPGQLEYAKDFLGNGKKWGAKFTYILQQKPAGLANIVEVCQQWVDNDNFVFHLGDNIFVDGVKHLVEQFEKQKPDAMIAMVHHSENTRLGVPYFDKNNQLIQFVEKPAHPPHDFAIPGIYFGNSNFFKCFNKTDGIKPSARGEYEISSPFQWLIDHQYKVMVEEYQGKWLDPGKFNDWLETNQYLLKNKLIDKVSSQLDSLTKISGKVAIGKNCSIKNCVINGPTAIGNDVKL